MPQPKRTAWFSNNEDPVYRGLYKVRHYGVQWAYYDGSKWRTPADTKEKAINNPVSAFQSFEWCGRAQPHRSFEHA